MNSNDDIKQLKLLLNTDLSFTDFNKYQNIRSMTVTEMRIPVFIYRNPSISFMKIS